MIGWSVLNDHHWSMIITTTTLTFLEKSASENDDDDDFQYWIDRAIDRLIGQPVVSFSLFKFIKDFKSSFHFEWIHFSSFSERQSSKFESKVHLFLGKKVNKKASPRERIFLHKHYFYTHTGLCESTKEKVVFFVVWSSFSFLISL